MRQIFASYKGRIEDVNYTYGLYYTTDEEIKKHYNFDKKEYFELGEDFEDFLFLKCERDFYKSLLRYFDVEIENLFSYIYDYENEYEIENQSIFILLKCHFQLKMIKLFMSIIWRIIDKKTNKQIINF